MSWTSCTDAGCEIYRNEKEDAGYWPKSAKVRKHCKKTKRNEPGRTSTSNTALEAGLASLPDIAYLSESLTPFRMNDTILATPPMPSPALYTRVKETGNKLHYLIRDGLLLAQNTNGYENLYIPVGPLEKGVSLRDFILSTVHEGLGHCSAYKCYSYAACFFWWPQMRQDFVLYCRSCDKCQINKEPTT